MQKTREVPVNDFVLWLGPLLRRRYHQVLRQPANWRMITMLVSLDEKAEHEANFAPDEKPIAAGEKPPAGKEPH